MSTLANKIEQYLKELLSLNEGVVEIHRSALARSFMCVPSQINYVLETRFTPEHGYYVESRRGGGGYLRVVRLSFSGPDELAQMVGQSAGKSISQRRGELFLDRLAEEGFITARENRLLKSMIDEAVLEPACENRNELRGRLIQSVLINILRDDFEASEKEE